MTARDTWRNCERIISSWFKTQRNMGSGRMNRDDQGRKRPGDSVYPYAVLESKYRGSGITSVSAAQETKATAMEYGRPWVHFEFARGNKKEVCIVMPFHCTELVCEFLDIVWRLNKHVGMHDRTILEEAKEKWKSLLAE